MVTVTPAGAAGARARLGLLRLFLLAAGGEAEGERDGEAQLMGALHGVLSWNWVWGDRRAGGSREGGNYGQQESRRKAGFSGRARIPACAGMTAAPLRGHFSDRIHFTRVLTSSSLTRGVRRHRDLAPDALAALLHLLDSSIASRLGVALVLGGDVLVRGADQLLVDGVAGGAGALLGELLVGEGGGCRRAAAAASGERASSSGFLCGGLDHAG